MAAADHATFEEVIYLLWYGRLPKQAELDQLKASLAANRAIPAEVIAFLKATGKCVPMDVLRTAVSMLSLYDADEKDTSIEASERKAVRLMAQTSTIVTTFDRLRKGQEVVASDPTLSTAGNFLYTLTGKKPGDGSDTGARLRHRADPSRRSIAQCFHFCGARGGGDPFRHLLRRDRRRCCPLKDRLHGGANEDVMKMLLEAGSLQGHVMR